MVEDKFIMYGIDDERSKDIADVLGNKTCKKILNYLADIKEASEKDISDALNMPINTVEYNLKKLVKSGLVEKTKNFFWSVKGKKIQMYKLAKKHIIISPKSTRPNIEKLKTILPVVFIAAALLFALLYSINNPENPQDNSSSLESKGDLKQFKSLSELNEFLKASAQNQENNYDSQGDGSISRSSGLFGGTLSKASSESISPPSDSSGYSEDYSKTNVQVEGVDEADIVKNDGKYIYTLSQDKLVIVNAYPVINMKIESEIKIPNSKNLYINKDKLVVFSESYPYQRYDGLERVRCLGCPVYSTSNTIVYIYDIKDRKNPVLERNYTYEGNYIESRMIGDYVYLVSSKRALADDSRPILYWNNGIEKEISLGDIYYFDYPDNDYQFNSVNYINVNKDETGSKVYLMGGSGKIYMSQENLYISYMKRLSYKDYFDKKVKEVYMEILPSEQKEKLNQVILSDDAFYEKQNKVSDIVFRYSNSLSGIEKENFDKTLQDKSKDFDLAMSKENEKTVVHKISVDKDEISYKNSGEVPGIILNQFSMDEFRGNFRIATTTGEVWNGNSMNNLYILDDDMEIIGKLEDLAQGEKIYSVRFMGEKAYIVTFKKVDPLFVIDVKDPSSPKILGYLKIPGYSDYLQPYDEDHIIGIGKEAVDASSEETGSRNLDFAWYQGVKISLFDVSDVSHPIEKAKFNIGDRGTDSPALKDHKAILFDKEKNLLVIPVLVAEIDKSKYENNNCDSSYYCKLTPYTYGENVYQGAYVLNINTENISLRGKITHFNTKDENNYGYKFYDSRYQIQRSLYIGDVLYTISDSRIKANDLRSIEELKSIDINYKEVVPVYTE
ncbi:MAG: beta-propeller domain-containing protein [Nanoarchaeota archaeon]|nr:beta-propeller domain-containing protein [Nanoarchaeota archaeon]